jgi:hypothetical protein
MESLFPVVQCHEGMRRDVPYDLLNRNDSNELELNSGEVNWCTLDLNYARGRYPASARPFLIFPRGVSNGSTSGFLFHDGQNSRRRGVSSPRRDFRPAIGPLRKGILRDYVLSFGVAETVSLHCYTSVTEKVIGLLQAFW